MSFRDGTKSLCTLLVMGSLVVPITSQSGQAPGRPAEPSAPPTPRAAAPIDLAGYWVSVVSEEWRYRMVTPAKGDFGGVPMTPEAESVANAWDPAADERAGEQCRSYGAPAIMRVPGRLHITWVDDNTLQMETDTGMQKRLFRFGAAASRPAEPSWQGSSAAAWDLPPVGGTMAESFNVTVPNRNPVNGTMKAVTKNLLPGYLHKNGIPYSENAVLTEYFNIVGGPQGTLWLVVTSLVEDARYLRQPFLFSTQFKKQSDSKGWDPTPCSSTW